MILGIGVDITQNSRFISWPEYDNQRLQHIFSEQELEAVKILDSQQKIQFFASRFAAKEAFFKAFSSALVRLKIHEQTQHGFDFLFACKHIIIKQGTFDIPQVIIDIAAFENKLGIKITEFQTDLTISHEKDYSVAVVTISQQAL
ncbi:MAG: Holo-[acyl-carrier-protein] synthase [candidate division TM6 bacterium GW2011_GWF2_37_49]|nr:MAG: Holo-[acyl-carrier-protein] synthase [candidate division TM6 bacterium GW2011_GWF2_37_49]